MRLTPEFLFSQNIIIKRKIHNHKEIGQVVLSQERKISGVTSAPAPSTAHIWSVGPAFRICGITLSLLASTKLQQILQIQHILCHNCQTFPKKGPLKEIAITPFLILPLKFKLHVIYVFQASPIRLQKYAHKLMNQVAENFLDIGSMVCTHHSTTEFSNKVHPLKKSSWCDISS
jgi:hypothetical protein